MSLPRDHNNDHYVNRVMLSDDEFSSLIDAVEGTKLEWKRELLLKPEKKAERAEFIRDMLSLVNSHGRLPAYMLIGVANDGTLYDVSSLGLKDENIQQSVNSLVEPPITFSYVEKQFNGQTLSYIEIQPSSNRPHVVKKDFTELKTGDTWIRDGSSKRRPNAWDYRQMQYENVAASQPRPEISIRFSDQTVDNIGKHGFRRAEKTEAERFGIGETESKPIVKPVDVTFVLENNGNAKANDVRVRLLVPKNALVNNGISGDIYDAGREGTFVSGSSSHELYVKAADVLPGLPRIIPHSVRLIIKGKDDIELEAEIFEQTFPKAVKASLILKFDVVGQEFYVASERSMP